MIVRMILTVLALVIVFGGIFGWKAWEGYQTGQEAMSAGPPEETVSTAPAETDVWQPRISAVGSLRAVQGVEIAPEIAGKIMAIEFDSGDIVEAGDVLVRIDDRTDRAELRELQADARLAEIELDRQRRLREQGVNSRADVDTAESMLDQTRARADGAQARVDKKTLRAPFAGRTGIVEADVGEFVETGHHLVTLQTLDPIHMDFSVPQQRVSDLRVGQDVEIRVDAFRDQAFPGRVQAISPRVEQRTRNINVRARVENDDELLRPGMFVNASLALDEEQDVITVPQTAITFSPYGETVYVVVEETDDDGETYQKAEQRFVETGRRRGDQIAVRDGLEEGEIVVTSGQIKLRDGIRVRINNDVQPDNDPDPEVGNT